MFVSLRGWRQKDPESVSQAYLVSSDKEREVGGIILQNIKVWMATEESHYCLPSDLLPLRHMHIHALV